MGIDSIIANNALPSAAATTSQQLGKQDFLNLLILQMRHQDPLNPMDNQAMLAQMAQFSSLEQMSNLNENFANANQISGFMDATRLLGKDVDVFDPSSAPDSPGVITSKVSSVSYGSSGPVLQLENGMAIGISDVVKVSEPAAS